MSDGITCWKFSHNQIEGLRELMFKEQWSVKIQEVIFCDNHNLRVVYLEWEQEFNDPKYATQKAIDFSQ